MTLDKTEAVNRIAMNVAELFDEVEDTTVLNLGVGIPTEVANYVTNPNIYLQAENGMLGVGEIVAPDCAPPDLINAGRQPVCETEGCCYFDSSMSFGMIRSGKVDVTVLGAFEVDEEGSVANWIIPNGKQLGVGGAMDLVMGVNTVVIAMRHTDKHGNAKIIEKCTLPITGKSRVRYIVTEFAVFEFLDGELTLIKKAPEISFEELKEITTANYAISEHIEEMRTN